jgi:hypothetical protein
MTHPPPIRLRFYINGIVLDEARLDMTAPDAETRYDEIRRRHQWLADVAEENGATWITEAYDPAKPLADAYLRRSGGPNKEGNDQ